VADGVILTQEQEDRARRLHEMATVIDCSIVMKPEESFFERAQVGGVTGFNHTVTGVADGLRKGIVSVNESRQWIKANAHRAVLATRVADIRKAKAEGTVAIIFGPQNADIVEDNLAYLEIFYDLGIRIMQLTYQTQNRLGRGCGEANDGGLSRFGFDVVRSMNKLGMVIDLSHCGSKTTLDAIEASDDPVIVSHANCYALRPHPRNKGDDVIRALAEKGGVIGATAFAPLAAPAVRQRPSIRDIVTHIDRMVGLVGIDHVGFSTDINERATPASRAKGKKTRPEIYYFYPLDEGGGWFYDNALTGEPGEDDQVKPPDFQSIRAFPELTKVLVSRGYSDSDILKILGGNFMRVFERVWDGV
jgi:membrane dipeptidase